MPVANHIRRFFLLATVCLLAWSPTHPQSHPLRFDHITTKDGLSQDIVTSIVRDAHGFVWFGTEDGLNRYDGYSIRVYKHNPFDTLSLAGNSVNALFVDVEGRLWVSTNGLNLYDEHTDRFIRIQHKDGDPHSLPIDHVVALCQDRNGSIWAGTDEGLASLDPGATAWNIYRHDPSDPTSIGSSIVRSLFVDRSGTLWVGTQRGLDRFNPETRKFAHIPLPRGTGNSTEPIAVTAIAEDHRGLFWLGTDAQGLIRFDPRTGQTKKFVRTGNVRTSPWDNLIFAVRPDEHGHLWIGHFGGLDIFDPPSGIFVHYLQSPADPDAIIGDRVYAIYPDRNGAMWIGTYHGGVGRYDPYRHKFNLVRSLSISPGRGQDGNILSLLGDSRRNMWVGTQSGLAIVRPSPGIDAPELAPVRVPPVSTVGGITALFEDSRRTVWVGHDKPGLLERVDLRGGVVRRYRMAGVRAIAEDRAGNLWFGTSDDGLIRFSPRTGGMTRYTNNPKNADSLWGDGVWSLFADREGRMWVGTGGTGECLQYFDPERKTFTHFTYNPADPASAPGGSVRTIYEDSSGTFWFGYWGSGLAKYIPSTNRFTVYLEDRGLANNYVKALLADDRNTLWISTERGISRFDPATETFRNYTMDDGLQGDRFYTGSATRGRDGTMYFGGEHGLNFFRPDSIGDDTTPPPVLLTSLKVFDKQLELPDAVWNTNEVELSYRQDFLAFEFVALGFSAPNRNRYAYTLQGFDRAWVDAGNRRYASYTHLDGGTYTFRVKAANADGIWNTVGASIQVVIDPPYWETLWFRILTGLTILALFYLAYRVRLGRILAVERLRQRIAQDLHDEVGTNLSTIALASQSLALGQRSVKRAAEALETIGTVAQRTTDQMKDIVWMLKTSDDSVGNLVAKMREVAGQLLSGVRYTFTAPSEEFPEKVDLEFKRNVFLFYKECLNNIVKHSEATAVKIHLDYAGKLFQLRIDDDGRGFSEKSVTPGSGLQNLRERGKLIKGLVTIESGPGRGTHISLVVKTTQMRHSFLGIRNVR